ncbi:MAG: M28 family peptidase [Bacteroidales bacterium]|nr:M28 family peptidase [Bacteroidales bacterium]
MSLLTKILPLMAACGACLLSCSGKTGTASRPTADATPALEERGAFSADSAYAQVVRQVALGPRTPGSEAHGRCADMLEQTLRRYGADTVVSLRGEATAWDGTVLPVRNIWARYNIAAPSRILLVAHYDTRPWADRDADEANHNTPIDGANDGASGVAVILEIARNLGLRAPEVGVDILLTDCEDSGTPAGHDTGADEDSWCLGTQLFADNLPYAAAERPRMGILLDMVGGRDARFHREYFSARRAPAATDKVWAMAARMGLGDRFPDAVGGAITDDHLPLIAAGIPTTDIIESANAVTGSFAPTWHTLDDNIDHIDRESLSAAGRVVLNVIYYEKP